MFQQGLRFGSAHGNVEEIKVLKRWRENTRGMSVHTPADSPHTNTLVDEFMRFVCMYENNLVLVQVDERVFFLFPCSS